MREVRLALCLAALLFSSISSASIAQSPTLSIPPESTQPSVDVNSSQLSKTDRLFERGRQQFYQGQLQNALQTFQQVLQLRRQAGDRLGEAVVLNSIAEISNRLSKGTEAQKSIEQSLAIVKDPSLLKQQQQRLQSIEAEALDSLGTVYFGRGDVATALKTAQSALAMRQQLKDRTGEGETLILVGAAFLNLGKQSQARDVLGQALQALTEPSFSADEQRSRRFYEGEALAWLGYLETISGNPRQAEKTLEQALTVNRKTGNRSYGELNTLYFIAVLQSNQSKWNEALESCQQLLNLSKEIGHRWYEGNALISMGGVYQAQNQHDRALAAYQQGLTIFKEISDRQKETETIAAIAGIYNKQKQYSQALKHYQQALAITREVKNRSSEASILQNIGSIHQTLKQYPQALERYQQALIIVREIKDRPREAQVLYAIGNIHYEILQYSQALAAYEQALPLFKEIGSLFVENDPNLGAVDAAIGQLYLIIGQIYSTLGRYSKSQEYLDRGITFLQSRSVKARKNKNSEIESVNLHSLMLSYQVLSLNSNAQKQYQQAIAYLQKAVELAKQLKDRQQEKGLYELLVVNYSDLGRAYGLQQDYEGSLKSYQQALTIAQENGLQRWKAMMLLAIGQIYVSKQNFTQGLNYQNQAQVIIDRSKDIFLQIQFFSTRGVIYRKLSRYQEALDDFKQANSLMQKAGDSLGAGSILSLIGAIYTDQKRYDLAISSYQQAQQALQNNPFAPFEHGINANNVEKLCAVAQKVGASEGLFSFADNCTFALRLGSEALKQAFILDGLNSLLVAQKKSLLTLKGGNFHLIGQLYLKQKNYNQALASYQQALPLLHEVGSPIEGATLGDMGIIYLLQGQYDRALVSSQQAVKISRAFNHRINEEDALYYLGIVYWAQGNVPSALDTLMKKSLVENENLANNLTIGSEESKRAFIQGKSKSIDLNVAFHLQSMPNNPEAAKLALTTVLQRKGRILDAVSDNVRRLRQNLQPEDRQLFDNLNTFRAALVNLLYDKQNPLSEKEFKTQVVSLKAKINELEDRLAQRSTEFRVESQPVTIEAVQALIPADAALVEFIRYSPFNPKASNTSQSWGSPRYAAAILTPRGNPKWIDLGEAAPIDLAVRQFRDGLRNQMPEPELRQKGQTLYNLLMSKAQAEVGNAHHLLVSPDSQLNLIPFAALVDSQNQYLVETNTITYLTSGRDLLRLQSDKANRRSRQVPVIIANPNFDRADNSIPAPIANAPNRSNSPKTATRESTQRSGDLGSRRFDPLPNTQAEALAIASLLPNALRLEGSQATENNLKQLQSPSILHIATHGFFFEDAPSFTQSNAKTALNQENPLLRSGLAFAGFNTRLSGSEDGVLTALEVTGLDLRGTRLVVLSACDTGLGGVLNGEGVYGLRRAFVIAGAESQMVSLWRVDDKASADLMSKYYRLLKAGRDRSEALRQVQLEMLQNPQYNHPYYWSAFIFSGDWHKMDNF
jgi:CHAT domain-containing protein